MPGGRDLLGASAGGALLGGGFLRPQLPTVGRTLILLMNHALLKQKGLLNFTLLVCPYVLWYFLRCCIV